VEVVFTDIEYDAVARLAAAYDISVPDVLRFGVMYLAAVLDEGGELPMALGSTMVIPDRPLPADLFQGLQKRRNRKCH
jgi:hypothetical protein